MQILGALGVLTFLATVKSIFNSITQKIREFKEKLDKKVEEWSKKIKELVSKADPYLQMIKEAFRQTLLVSLLGPFAIMDDGVWGTIKRVVQFVMKTPCLRELGGLFRVPAVMQKIDGFRTNLKAMWKVIQNPDPLLDEIKNAIQPMVAKVEPEVRQRVFSQSQGGGAPAPPAGGVSPWGLPQQQLQQLRLLLRRLPRNSRLNRQKRLKLRRQRRRANDWPLSWPNPAWCRNARPTSPFQSGITCPAALANSPPTGGRN